MLSVQTWKSHSPSFTPFFQHFKHILSKNLLVSKSNNFKNSDAINFPFYKRTFLNLKTYWWLGPTILLLRTTLFFDMSHYLLNCNSVSAINIHGNSLYINIASLKECFQSLHCWNASQLLQLLPQILLYILGCGFQCHHFIQAAQIQ